MVKGLYSQKLCTISSYLSWLFNGIVWEKSWKSSVKIANVLIQTPWLLMHIGDKIHRKTDSQAGRQTDRTSIMAVFLHDTVYVSTRHTQYKLQQYSVNLTHKKPHRCGIIKHSWISDSTYANLIWHRQFFVSAPALRLYNLAEQYSIWISPSPAGSGSSGASCVLYGVFIAEEFDRAEDRGSGNVIRDIPLINRTFMTDLFVLSKDDLFTHYVLRSKSSDFVDMQNISHTCF